MKIRLFVSVLLTAIVPAAAATHGQEKAGAAGKDVKDTPTLLADGGVENYNGAVNELIDTGLLKRVLARTEITFSNSLIESFWRILKHQWLYLNTLDSAKSVEKLVAFYVREHNSRLPHSRRVKILARTTSAVFIWGYRVLAYREFGVCTAPSLGGRSAGSPSTTPRQHGYSSGAERKERQTISGEQA